MKLALAPARIVSGLTRTFTIVLAVMSVLVSSAFPSALQTAPPIPTTPLVFGAFSARFGDDGRFTLEGEGWPSFIGTWKRDGAHVELVTVGGPELCAAAGRYRVQTEGHRLTLDVVSDGCTPRRMILDHSRWLPAGTAEPRSPRSLLRTAASPRPPLPAPVSAAGSWPTFRGAQAAGFADGQNLPDHWDVQDGDKYPVAHADSGPGTLQPCRLGKPHLPDERGKHRPEGQLSPRPVWRR